MKKILIAMMAVAGFTSCEKPYLDETPDNENATETNVVLRFVPYEQDVFGVGGGSSAATRAATDITELCSRLNIAIFDGEGGGGGTGSGDFHMTADPDWDSVNGYTF